MGVIRLGVSPGTARPLRAAGLAAPSPRLGAGLQLGRRYSPGRAGVLQCLGRILGCSVPWSLVRDLDRILNLLALGRRDAQGPAAAARLLLTVLAHPICDIRGKCRSLTVRRHRRTLA